MVLVGASLDLLRVAVVPPPIGGVAQHTTALEFRAIKVVLTSVCCKGNRTAK